MTQEGPPIWRAFAMVRFWIGCVLEFAPVLKPGP